MVLEYLLNPWKARKRPGWLFLVGILFSIIAVIFSLWVFEGQASMLMVLLVVLMSIPLVYTTMVIEEEKDLSIERESSILKEHARTLLFLTLLFLGFVVGFTLLYLFLPGETVQGLFSAQHAAIDMVNSNVTGAVTGVGAFFSILGNNLRVLVFCVIFAFFFGAGAIFILSWNASVIAAAIGSTIREGLASIAGAFGWNSLAAYFHIVAFGFLRYLTHGVFEILGYFIAGLAGGVISIGLMRHGLKSREFSKVLYDGATMLIIALVVLIFAGLIEVFVTPLLF